MTGHAFANGPGKKAVSALVRESGRSEIIAERNQVAAFRELKTGFFAQLAQSDRSDSVQVHAVAGIVHPGSNFIDLARRYFPDRGPNGYSLLPNEDQFSVGRHRRDNDGAFAPDDCPGTRLGAGRAPNFFRDDSYVLVFETGLAGNHFPIPGRIDIPLHAGKVMANASLNKERRFTNRRQKKRRFVNRGSLKVEYEPSGL